MAAQAPPPRPIVRQSGGALVLAADARVAFILINEARYRALERLLGCSRDQANVATLVGGALLAHEIHERWRRLMNAPVSGSLPDNLIGTALLRELLSDVAGSSVRDSPERSNLLLAALLAGAAGPLLIKSLGGIRATARRIDAGFRHRYGYLIDVGHRRARRYERGARKVLAGRQTGSAQAAD